MLIQNNVGEVWPCVCPTRAQLSAPSAPQRHVYFLLDWPHWALQLQSISQVREGNTRIPVFPVTHRVRACGGSRTRVSQEVKEWDSKVLALVKADTLPITGLCTYPGMSLHLWAPLREVPFLLVLVMQELSLFMPWMNSKGKSALESMADDRWFHESQRKASWIPNKTERIFTVRPLRLKIQGGKQLTFWEKDHDHESVRSNLRPRPRRHVHLFIPQTWYLWQGAQRGTNRRTESLFFKKLSAC